MKMPWWCPTEHLQIGMLTPSSPHPQTPSTIGGMPLLQPISVRIGPQHSTVLHVLVLATNSGSSRDFIAVPELKECLAKPLSISKSAFYRAVHNLPASKKRKPHTSSCLQGGLVMHMGGD